jgi:hypothetical protein
VPADANRMPDEPLPFLPDGRFAGWEGPGQEAKIAACQAAGAPGSHPPESKSWPLRIELPRDLEHRDPALTITTDTGYAPEGGVLSVIEQGYRIPLRLHPDTQVIAVTLEAEGGPVSTALRLPMRVTDALTGAQPCGWPPTIIIRLDGDLTPHLRLGDDAKACP